MRKKILLSSSSCPFLKNGCFRMHLFETSDIRQAAFFQGTRVGTMFKNQSKSLILYYWLQCLYKQWINFIALYCWLWIYWSCQSNNFNWIFWWDLFWWFSNKVMRPFKNHLEEAWAIFTRKIHCQSGDLSSWISLPSSAWMGHKKTAASLHFLVSVIWYQGFHKRGEKVLLLFWLG